eukprot:Skav213567  [mRNA]  locus=scaffold3630:173333:179768:+ [translate_table: standard]
MVRWDDFLSYSADVKVKIRDWKLGILQWVFQILIALYILVYQVWFKCGYLVKPDVDVSVVASLKKSSALHPEYCAPPGNYSCIGLVCPCRDPLVEEVLHTTRDTISIVTSTREVTPAGLSEIEYTANIEGYKLLIEPTIYQKQKGEMLPSQVLLGNEVEGWLLVGSLKSPPTKMQHELCAQKAQERPSDVQWWWRRNWPWQRWIQTKTAPCYVKADHNVFGNDEYNVSTLLRSMNVSLDDVSGSDLYRNRSEILRRSGFSVMVSLTVHSYRAWQWPPWQLPLPYYTLDFEMAGDKSRSNHFGRYGIANKGGHLVHVHEHGINIVIMTSGTLAELSATSLLHTLTSGLTLMAVAAVLVKLVATCSCETITGIHCCQFLRKYHFGLSTVYDRAMTRRTPRGKDMEKLMTLKRPTGPCIGCSKSASAAPPPAARSMAPSSTGERNEGRDGADTSDSESAKTSKSEEVPLSRGGGYGVVHGRWLVVNGWWLVVGG